MPTQPSCLIWAAKGCYYVHIFMIITNSKTNKLMNNGTYQISMMFLFELTIVIQCSTMLTTYDLYG